MSQTMQTTYDSVIEQIVQSVFATMLEMEVWRTEEVEPACVASQLATVQIAGQWMGSVVLGLSPELSAASAAAMFQTTPDVVTEDDRREVAAELTNMIGGNLKSILPGPSFLSLPTIISGREFGLRVHDAELVDDVRLESQHGPMQIRLYAQTKRD